MSEPAFGYSDGSIAAMLEYNSILYHFLALIQQEDSNLITENDDVKAHYSLFCSLQKTAEGRAWAAHLNSDMQNAMNRWKKIKAAKGRRPRFNMVDHYSQVRDLMSVTWRYLYIQ